MRQFKRPVYKYSESCFFTLKQEGKIKMDLQEISVKGVKALVRPGTLDEYVVDEIIKKNTYKKLNIYAHDTVLDIGMNIGMFAIKAAQTGAEVHAYEPDPDNFELAKQNIALNGLTSNISIYKKAVTGTQDEIRSFSLNVKKNKGAHSLIAKRGRNTIQVNCVNINDVIDQINPTVIKLDIEGGEYEVIKAMNNFTIMEFIIEFHHAHLNDIKTKTKFHEIIGILEKQFDHVEYKKDPKGAWYSMIYCF